MPSRELGIEDEEQAGRHTLSLTGELDIAAAVQLERAVTRLCQARAEEIVLDLHSLSFIDSSGFRAVIAARHVCEEYECAFYMTRATYRVERLFDIAGMLKWLPLRRTPAHATPATGAKGRRGPPQSERDPRARGN